MKWRVANSLLILRNQVNAKFPGRNKDWDGTIGDANHASRNSDHNPWVDGGVVTAMDITHDPKNGVDSYEMAEQLRQGRDPRIKYIISNRKIASSTTSPWKWRKYTGSNPHDHHVHISVNSQKRYYDDEAPWEIPMLGKVPSEAAESQDEEVGDEVSTTPTAVGIVDTVADTVGTVSTVTEKIKPMTKSRISWGATALGTTSTATAIANAPPSTFQKAMDVLTSPTFWLILLNIVLTGFVLWHYWADHGRGLLRKRDEEQ